MNFTPEHLKERTDAALSLLDEVQRMNIDELKLKPREAKAVYQVSTVGSKPRVFVCHKHCQPLNLARNFYKNLRSSWSKF